jgi:hypothetical protein
MAATATAKAWADAAQQLKDRQQLEAACRTICRLASQHDANIAAARTEVLKHKLPQALFITLAAVLGERNRQRDWRTAGYAARVYNVVSATVELLHVPGLFKQQVLQGSAGAASSSSSSSSSSGDHKEDAAAARAVTMAAVGSVVPQAVLDTVLSQLALAVNEVAAVLEVDNNNSSSSSSSQAGSSHAACLPCVLATFIAVLVTEPAGPFSSPRTAQLAAPTARLAMAALSLACRQTRSSVTDVGTHQIPTPGGTKAWPVLGQTLLRCVASNRYDADEKDDSDRELEYRQLHSQLLRSPHFAQLIIIIIMLPIKP